MSRGGPIALSRPHKQRRNTPQTSAQTFVRAVREKTRPHEGEVSAPSCFAIRLPKEKVIIGSEGWLGLSMVAEGHEPALELG